MSIGREHDTAPIGRPDGPEIVRAIEGEPRRDTPRGIDEPDVLVAVDRPIYRDALPIWRQFHLAQTGHVGSANDTQAFAGSIQPRQLPGSRAARAGSVGHNV